MAVLYSTLGGSRVNFKGGLLFTPMSLGLEVIKLVQNLDTWSFGGTEPYPGGSRVNFKGA